MHRHLFLFALACLAACTPKVAERGYTLDASQVEEVQLGMNQDEVRRLLGSPSVESQFGDRRWYYVTATKETIAFFKPEVVEQRVVEIAFDDSGSVSGIQRYSEEDAQEIAIKQETTPTEGHSLTFIEQLLGNLGRVGSGGGMMGPRHTPGR